MTDRETKLNRTELLMNYGWIGIDAGWMLEWNLFALACIVPTLCYGALMFRYTKRDLDSFCITTAMAAWGCMSCGWFVHEVGWWRHGMVVAILSLVTIVLMIIIVETRRAAGKETARAALERFRRLRLR